MPLSNCQWILQTIQRRQTLPVPYRFSFSPPALRRAQSHYGENLPDAIGLPIRTASPTSIKPSYADPKTYGAAVRDEFGVAWTTNAMDRGTPVGPCLPESTLAGYSFPPADAEYRFEHLAAWCRQQEGNFRLIWIGDLWERATFMRGMEDMLMDVALEPAFVESLLRGLTDYILRTMQILFSRFEFEAIGLTDDYGTQRSMVMSPADWRRLIKPRIAEIYALAKQHGRIVLHHSCGHIVPIIGDLIDIGLDVLHPIQPEAMDSALLKREFGRHLSFCGGIGTQQLLVKATSRQVRAEVQRLKREMGHDGGYILEPGITLQDDVPLENIVAMIDEARNGA